MGDKHLSPTKAVMQFRIAALEKQVKVVTEKLKQVIQAHNALSEQLSGQIARSLITEKLLVQKAGVTPAEIEAAAAEVAAEMAQEEEQARQQEAAAKEAEEGAGETKADADDPLIGEPPTSEPQPLPTEAPAEPAQESASALHAV